MLAFPDHRYPDDYRPLSHELGILYSLNFLTSRSSAAKHFP